jgi:hypothetical protein
VFNTWIEFDNRYLEIDRVFFMSQDSKRAQAVLELWVEACAYESAQRFVFTTCLIELFSLGSFAENRELNDNLAIVISNMDRSTLLVEKSADQAVEYIMDHVQSLGSRNRSPEAGGYRVSSGSVDVLSGETTSECNTEASGKHTKASRARLMADETRRVPRSRNNWDWKSERRLYHLVKIFGTQWREMTAYLPKWPASHIKDKNRRQFIHFNPDDPQRPGDVSDDSETDTMILSLSSSAAHIPRE